MNKIEKIQKELKVRFGLVTVTAATIFSLGACGNTNTNTNQNTPSTPSTTVEVDNPVETTDPVEVEPVETTDPVEVEPVEEAFTVTADQITILTDLQCVGHPQIPKEEMLAVAMSFNWDYISDEDKDALMNQYGLSLEDLDGYFMSFIERDITMCQYTHSYYLDDIAVLPDEYNYENWINYTDFAFKQEDKDLATNFGYYFLSNAREMKYGDDVEKNSFDYTLFYVLEPVQAIEDMQMSSIFSSSRTITK